jgi:hypothetical protein
MTNLKSLFAATVLVSLTAASGCVKQDAAPSQIAKGIPTASQVAIKLPLGQAKSIGQLAPWYVATRNVTRTFNGGTGWVLVLIHSIVQYPVTSVSGDTYTWGPWSDALNPAEYKLDVTALADGTYDYTLSGRNKTIVGSAFETVIDGHSDPRPGDNLGNGSFLLDFDAGKRVNPVDSGDGKGQLNISYDLAQRHLDLTLMSTDATGAPVAADYAYNEQVDGSGDMVFDVTGDVDHNGSKIENVTLRSRWLPTGAGRADARVSGGDIAPNQATASECWDGVFGRTFYTVSIDPSQNEGQETACAFATADLPPAR